MDTSKFFDGHPWPPTWSPERIEARKKYVIDCINKNEDTIDKNDKLFKSEAY